MRLDDINYKNQRLDGTAEPPAALGPIEFYQGEDVVLDFFLAYNDSPVVPADWRIEVLVKKNAYAKTRLWEAVLNNGLYASNVAGYYKVIIPSEATSTFLAGTYWMDVFIHEKLGRRNGPKDLDIIVLRQPFSIDYAAASPNPGTTLASSNTEHTYPPPIDITKL